MITFLTVNGVGRGHLQRTLIMSSWIEKEYGKSLVFYQGSYPQIIGSIPAGTSIETLYKIKKESAQEIVLEIARLAALSEPMVVIEDTHPSLLRFPSNVRRVVVVRPTKIDHMRRLAREVGKLVDAFFICDSPSSPTWPYNDRDTAELLQWEKWSVVGPIYREPNPEEIQTVRAKYRISKKRRVVVCSLGGGGQHKQGDRDFFVKSAAVAAYEIRLKYKDCRFLFVCGPLFPKTEEIPSIFERIESEPALHALLASSSAAIIRPGFNVVWECLAAGTPMLPITTTTVAEPITERVERLRSLKVATDRPHDLFSAEVVKAASRLRFSVCNMHAEHKVQYAFTDALRGIIKIGAGPFIQTKTAEDQKRVTLHHNFSFLKEVFVIRVVDIIAPGDPRLADLVQLCQQYGFRPTLEIVPYFASNCESLLSLVSGVEACEIVQHGYSHAPEFGQDGKPLGETGLIGNIRARAIRVRLGTGMRRIKRIFGGLFKGGYSAPYGALHPLVIRVWDELGGRYIIRPTRPKPCDHHCEPDNFECMATPPVLKIAYKELHRTAYRSNVKNILSDLKNRGCRSLLAIEAYGRNSRL